MASCVVSVFRLPSAPAREAGKASKRKWKEDSDDGSEEEKITGDDLEAGACSPRGIFQGPPVRDPMLI